MVTQEELESAYAELEHRSESVPTLIEFAKKSEYSRYEVYNTFDSFNDLQNRVLWRQGRWLYKNPAWLRFQYHQKQLSTTEIADLCNANAATIHNFLEKYDIETRGRGEANTEGDLSKLKDREWLHNAYIENGRSAPDIAEECGLNNPTTVYQWLERHDIERRTSGETLTNAPLDKLQNKEWLYTQYKKNSLGTYAIGQKLRCSESTVRRWLQRYGIELRPHSNADLERLNDPEQLERLYHEEELSLSEVAEELGTHMKTVHNKMIEFEIPRRNYMQTARRGRDHHNFKEEKTTNYGPNWREKRIERRIIDQGRCQVCGRTDAENIEKAGRVNSVHHIEPRSEFINDDYTLDYEEANKLENLITLCDRHHQMYEGIPIDNR